MQDAVNVRRAPARLFHLIDSIRNQAATFREVTERIDSWQIELASQDNDKLASESSDWTGCDDNPAIWLPRKGCEDWFDVIGVACAGHCYCDIY